MALTWKCVDLHKDNLRVTVKIAGPCKITNAEQANIKKNLLVISRHARKAWDDFRKFCASWRAYHTSTTTGALQSAKTGAKQHHKSCLNLLFVSSQDWFTGAIDILPLSAVMLLTQIWFLAVFTTIMVMKRYTMHHLPMFFGHLLLLFEPQCLPVYVRCIARLSNRLWDYVLCTLLLL